MGYKNWIVALATLASVAVAGAQSVATFTEQDLGGLIASGCGPQAINPKDIHIHRNAAGNMLYVVAEGKFEALIYAQQQSCHPLSPETLNLWRNNTDGSVIAQLASRFDGERLLIGDNSDGISGSRFDIEPSGQYLVISHGETSSVSPVDRPYIRTIEIQMDAQRIFLRQGGLLVVGSNKSTNQLEAVPVSLLNGTASAGAPIVVPGVPAGVMVLDYNDKTDELLLGGLNAAGVTSFAIANLSSGGARLVDNVKPGAVTALFISDSGLAARIGGQPVPAGAGAPSQSAAPAGEAAPKKRGFNLFGLFGRK